MEKNSEKTGGQGKLVIGRLHGISGESGRRAISQADLLFALCSSALSFFALLPLYTPSTPRSPPWNPACCLRRIREARLFRARIDALGRACLPAMDSANSPSSPTDMGRGQSPQTDPQQNGNGLASSSSADVKPSQTSSILKERRFKLSRCVSVPPSLPPFFPRSAPGTTLTSLRDCRACDRCR